MRRKVEETVATDRPVAGQRAVDAAEERSIASYRMTSSFLRSLQSTVEEAARRADAMHRLDIALGFVTA